MTRLRWKRLSCAAPRTGPRLATKPNVSMRARQSPSWRRKKSASVAPRSRPSRTRNVRALRRTQQAAAEARRRAEELERRRKEAAYLAQFGELPPREDPAGAAGATTNAPSVVIPPPEEATGQSYEEANPYEETRPVQEMPASDGGNAPVAEPAPEADLDAVREELRRRAEESESQ